MAQFNVTGLDELTNDLRAVAALEDSIVLEMLNAEADILVDAQKNMIERLEMVDTGQLLDSIDKTPMRKGGASRYMEVYPQGIRDNGVRNAEVGYINEYGAPGRHIPAKNWMNRAIEDAQEDMVQAARDIYSDYLKSKNL